MRNTMWKVSARDGSEPCYCETKDEAEGYATRMTAWFGGEWAIEEVAYDLRKIIESL